MDRTDRPDRPLEPMDVDGPLPTGPVKPPIVKVHIQPGEFDLEAYINNYKGHTRMSKLIFILEHCPELEVDALMVAVREAKQTQDTLLYRRIHELGGAKVGEALDQAWIDGIERGSAQTYEKLDNELTAARNALQREQIRVMRAFCLAHVVLHSAPV